MNIFVTDPSAVTSAQCLPDKHIVKMPLETCQMLAIVASKEWGHDFGSLPKLDGTPYKTSKGAFRGHPCTIWAQDNWTWLVLPIAFTIVGILVYAYIQTAEEKKYRNIN